MQYAIDEARAAGIKEFIFVTSRGKSALEDYFDSAPELEQALIDGKKTALLELLKQTDMPSGSVAYIRQQERRGLGHAVWCARNLIGDEPFAVMLPDDVIDAETPCLQQMVEAYEEIGGGNMVATMEVPHANVSSYGILDVDSSIGATCRARHGREAEARRRAVEHGGDRPLHPVAERAAQPRHRRGGRRRRDPAHRRHRSRDRGEQRRLWLPLQGTPLRLRLEAGYLQATVAFGLARPDLRDEFLDFLRTVTEHEFRQPAKVASRA